jgi:hypothetical protein
VLSSGRPLAEEAGGSWNREYVRRQGNRLFATVSNTTLEFLSPAAPADLTGAWKLSNRTQNSMQREAVLTLMQKGQPAFRNARQRPRLRAAHRGPHRRGKVVAHLRS